MLTFIVELLFHSPHNLMKQLRGEKKSLNKLKTMVLILDGNSRIDAHVKSNFCYLICLRHMIDGEQLNIGSFSSKRPIFLLSCATCVELPSNIKYRVENVNGWSTYVQRARAAELVLRPHPADRLHPLVSSGIKRQIIA